MRNERTLDPEPSTLTDFSTLVWRELWTYGPEGRRSRNLAGLGALLVGLSVASLVLFGIYRSLGAVLLGPAGAVPEIVWIASGAGVAIGLALLGVAAYLRRRRMPVLMTADAESLVNGHAIPRGSHNA